MAVLNLGLCGAWYVLRGWTNDEWWIFVLLLLSLPFLSLLLPQSTKGLPGRLPKFDDKYRELFESLGDAVLVIQAEEPHGILEANSIACERLGFTRSELQQMKAADITVADHRMEIARIREALAEKRRHIARISVVAKNGMVAPIEVNCNSIMMGQNHAIAIISRDLSERRQMERRVRESERFFHSLFVHNPTAIGVFDAGGRLIQANAAVSQYTGYSEQELHRRQFVSFFAAESIAEATRRYAEALTGANPSFDSGLLRKDGYQLDVHTTLVPVKDSGELHGIIAICQDISERKRSVERMRHMAYYDDKTGLPNRRLFKKRLSAALESITTGTVAVYYLDIDSFKLVNDSFGHDYGDVLLLQVAERFSRCITETNFLARTEGDEFAMFFTGLAGAEGAKAQAEQILAVLEEPFAVGDYQHHFSACIGIAHYDTADGTGQDAETLLKHADIALSRAKERGRGSCQGFNADMKLVSLHRLTMEGDLRRALVQNEFILYFQPQIEVKTGALVGMEALIRWNRQDKGLVPPRDFIPVAEECGLIVAIGEWVLTESCRLNKLWQDKGLPCVPVSVNLSMRQFLQSNLRDRVEQILKQTGLEPRYLDLEITESMTMDVDYATTCLHELKKLGLKISIDDFGTGYSSLSYLKKFPIDKLKIDRSFVRDIMVDPNDAAIVSAIIAMAHHLHVGVIAEGVETQEQLDFLYQNACNQVQGYCFSPPLPFAELEAFVSRIAEAAPARETALD